MKILCFGDSNTYGYDPRGFLGGRYPENVRWTGRLKEAGYDVVNLGQNGREIPSTETAINRLKDCFLSHNPFDLLLVMLGSNDLLMHRNFTAEDAAGRMENSLDYLTKEIPAEKIILIAPPPMNPGEWVDENRLLTESRRFGSCYRAVAWKMDTRFADASEWDISTAFDGVHFTEKGHAAFAEGIEQVLKVCGLL